MNETSWIAVAAPVIIALVALAKGLGFPSQYAGALAVALGVAAGAAVHFLGEDALAKMVYYGLLAGLSAGGLYSGVKNATERRE